MRTPQPAATLPFQRSPIFTRYDIPIDSFKLGEVPLYLLRINVLMPQFLQSHCDCRCGHPRLWIVFIRENGQNRLIQCAVCRHIVSLFVCRPGPSRH
jgi:hypothetical protein